MNHVLRKKRGVLVLLLAAAALAGGGAQAQTVCSVAGSSDLGINFGTYTDAELNVNSAGTLKITCSNPTNRTIYIRACMGLDAGSGGAQGGNRLMKNGSSELNYQLYRDVARTLAFGSSQFSQQGSTNPMQLAPFQSNVTLDTGIRVYGRVFSGQTPMAQGVHNSVFTGGDMLVTAQGRPSQFPANCALLGATVLDNATSFTVQANAVPWCKITSTPLIDFGTQSAPLTTNVTTTGALKVRCSIGNAYTIGADLGQNGEGTTVRRMRLGATNSYIRYELHRSSAYNQLWRTPLGSRFSGTGTGLDQTHIIHGLVRSAQNTGNLAVGEYTDMVVVTLYY